jgi:predicted Zn-dependent protease
VTQRFRFSAAAILSLALASPAAAQTGRALGTVRDTSGRPIKGATVKASNPDAPIELTSTTDDRGRFVMLGLRSGVWTFVAEAPGFFKQEGKAPIRTAPGPPLDFTLARDPGPIPGALTKDIQAQLDVAATLRKEGRFDQAISAYEAIRGRNAKLTTVNLVLGSLYREQAARTADKAARQRLLDQAISAYQEVIDGDVPNERARIEVGMTYIAAGNLEAAESTLSPLASAEKPGADVLYGLGEIRFIRGEYGEAAKLYQQAAATDITWLRPKLKLGLLALRQGEKESAIKMFEEVIAAEPTSPDATEAAGYLKQLTD